MKRIYISTLRRCPQPESNGGIHVVDWDEKRVLSNSQYIVPSREKEGRSWGMRGITWFKNRLFVGRTDERIMQVDPDTMTNLGVRDDSRIRHVHQLKAYEDKLYIVSTGVNRILMSPDGFNFIQHREIEDIADVLDPFVPEATNRKHPQWNQDRVHCNSVAWWNGDEYHVYANIRMVYNWTKRKIVWEGAPLSMPHDFIVLDEDRFVVNTSAMRASIVFEGGQPRIFHKEPERPKVLEPRALPGWTRGGACADGILFICAAPGLLRAFDAKTLKLVETMEFTPRIGNKEQLAPYDIVLDPRDWGRVR